MKSPSNFIVKNHVTIRWYISVVVGDNYDDEDDPTIATSNKAGNVLPVWGNEKSMNLNSLILTNIQGSPYFKVQLFGLKTYHEVIDEIYYRVSRRYTPIHSLSYQSVLLVLLQSHYYRCCCFRAVCIYMLLFTLCSSLLDVTKYTSWSYFHEWRNEWCHWWSLVFFRLHT